MKIWTAIFAIWKKLKMWTPSRNLNGQILLGLSTSGIGKRSILSLLYYFYLSHSHAVFNVSLKINLSIPILLKIDTRFPSSRKHSLKYVRSTLKFFTIKHFKKFPLTLDTRRHELKTLRPDQSLEKAKIPNFPNFKKYKFFWKFSHFLKSVWNQNKTKAINWRV